MIIMELLMIKIEGEIILKILGTILEVARHLTVFLMKALVVVLEVEVSSVLSKAMKSSPLLGPFCGSEFWGVFSVENIKRLCVFMFQT